jgi:NAD+ kinase
MIRRVTIVAHSGKKRAAEIAADLGGFLVEHDIDVVDDRPDLVVSLGGDGTMLRAARVAHSSDALLLGVNLGTLGYLTEVDAGDERLALEKLLAGSFDIEERMMLTCEVDADGHDHDHIGLNEVLVERSSRNRLVRLKVTINGEQLASFNADGVIVATPTGSTAYALSAGGPIVSPQAQCLVLVPVSAHMIFSRPFVLAPTDVVDIRVDDQEGQDASMALDGYYDCDLAPGSSVVVSRHPRPLKLVRLSGPLFLERLRAKLGLP